VKFILVEKVFYSGKHVQKMAKTFVFGEQTSLLRKQVRKFKSFISFLLLFHIFFIFYFWRTHFVAEIKQKLPILVLQI